MLNSEKVENSQPAEPEMQWDDVISYEPPSLGSGQTYEERKRAEEEYAAQLRRRQEERREAAKARKDRVDDTRGFLLAQGKEMQKKLQRAERAISTYNKAVTDKRPPEEIALIAAKALSLAMSEDLLYDRIKTWYKEEYGVKLDEKCPYKIRRCR